MNTISFRPYSISPEAEAFYANYQPTEEDRKAFKELWADEAKAAAQLKVEREIASTETMH